MVGKSIAALLIGVLFRFRWHALTVSASLAQIGEFSFIRRHWESPEHPAHLGARPDPRRSVVVDHTEPAFFAIQPRMSAG